MGKKHSQVPALSTVPITHSRAPAARPLVDYSKSILLISDDYLRQVESLATKRNDTARGRDAKKVATKERKRKREEERLVQLQKRKERNEVKADKAREKAYWDDIARHGWGNELQALLKSTVPPPPCSYRGVYVGNVPAWCITNQH
jgi:hypothetical protein